MKNLRYNNICLRALTILCLMMASVGAWAIDIVMYSQNNGYLSINTAGNGITVGTFQGNRSLWETSGELGSTARTIRSKAYTTNHYLYSDANTASTNITISNTNTVRWQYRNNYLCTRANGTNYYLRYANGTLNTANTTDNNRFTYYTYTTNNVTGSTEDFTISGPSLITSAGNHDFSHTNKVVTPTHTHYAISNGDNYYDVGGNITTTNPRTESTTGYVWSLTGGGSYASIHATSGRLTVTSMPSDDVDMTVTCTLNGVEQQSMTVTLSPATPAGYAIMNDNTHFLGGTSTTNIGSFDPKTCLWTGTSGGTWRNSASYYLRMQTSGYINRTYTMSLNQTNSSNWDLTGTESGTTGRKLDDATYSRYVRYNNGWTTTETSTDGGTNVVFSVLKKTGAESSTAPTVSGDATIATLGNNSSYAHTDAAYTQGYNDYIFYNGAHHYWKSDDSEAIAGNTKPSAEEFTYTWSLSGNAAGYATVNPSTGVITYSTYYDDDTNVTLTLTATSANKTFTVNKTVQFQSPKNDPTGISATDMTLNVGEQKTITPTLTPNPCYTRLNFTSDNTNIATVNATTGEVTGVAGGQTTVTIKAYKYSAPTEYLQTTITVTVMEKVATPVIEFTPQGEGETASTTITCGTADAKIYYTTDGSTPSASSTLYEGAFNVNNLDEVKAIAVKDGGYFEDSEVASAMYSKHKMPTPEITITNGQVSFTCPEDGASFYYTIDGSTPTTSSTLWTGTPFTPTADECTIKVIAVKAGSQNSDVAERPYVRGSGVSGGTVYLNDYEDHTWTYYAGVDSEVDGGNYNTNYKGKLYSPNPRNVKITYKANGGAVSIDESETEFVYYKTLEESATAGEYQYQVISNPFSKRPNGKGFGGWQITKGADYIKNKNANATLDLDEEIVFENLPYPSVNCTSAEIELTATWVNANIQYGGGNINATAFRNGNYETNLLVINANYANALTPSYPVTIMMVEPDGSRDYRNTYTLTSSITPVAGAENTTKIEFARWQPGADIDPQGRNFTIGRGMNMSGGTARRLYGTNTSANVNQVVKAESGRLSSFYHYGKKPSSIVKQVVVFGNDYDRAKNDNSKLNITGICKISSSLDLGLASTRTMMCRTYSKSGQIMSTIDVGSGATENVYYYSPDGGQQSYHGGCRYLEIQGGEWCGIAGGFDYYHNADDPAFTFRMKGGLIRGPLYGGGEFYAASGNRCYVLTGGTIRGWLASGANGTRDSGGQVNGESFMYVGGKARVDSQGNNTKINNAVGGNVFGAGCGYSATSTSGELTNGTNVVVADEAYIERGVYGGGGYGYTTATSNLYITGGIVGGVYENTVPGGVFGGAQQNKGGNVNIYMTGGKVLGGVFGGSNSAGTLSGSVKMQINGGQVGEDAEHTANIHGGGYGNSTVVSRNVDITLGKTGAERDADGVTVWGDVYGGSALGSVNGETATNTYHTNVTMNAGYINGSIYGGALGSNTVAANVYGPVQVKVYGGSVFNTDGTGANGSGAVYGANNINGAPQRSVTVDIYGTNSAPAEGEYALFSVYGGGNQADYTYGNGYPTVTVHNCDNSIEYVYGGGNAAAVAATDVTIWGGDKIGNVFGGGNGQVKAANVNGGTNVKIYGGTIGDVYGGSNTQGTIGGAINVNVNAQAEGGSPACLIDIDNVYGGGNKAASNVGNVTIGCAEHIGAVYGGANQADVTGNIALNIVSGHIDNVFGGNNNSGHISGSITVNVNDNGSACGMEVGNVFGGGNKAQYGTVATAKSPTVNILNGHVTGNVFGGGLGITAVVTGCPQVTIGDATRLANDAIKVTIGGDVYGGGDAAAVLGTPVVKVVNKCNTEVANVYGGGNAADVSGTDVTIHGGTFSGMVFGGGHGDKNSVPQKEANVNGNVALAITGGTISKVFAGSNSKGNITGTANLIVNKGAASCPIHITELYGGGNEAAGNAGTISILNTGGDSEGIGTVFGGANDADINSNIALNITGGNIGDIFGGNNNGGQVKGNITVNVNWTGTGVNHVGNVYGGGNIASIDNGTPRTVTVNIPNATVSGSVFGGGKGQEAVIVGSTNVNIGDWNGAHQATIGGDVFGGGDLAAVEGPCNVTIRDCGTLINGTLYGGGNAAPVYATNTTVWGGTITGDVFGGGNGADATKNAKGAQVGYQRDDTTPGGSGNATTNIYGGTIGVWNGGNCTAGGGVFGGSNTTGDIKGEVIISVEEKQETAPGANLCSPLKFKEIYGAGNLAAYAGTGITFNLGCAKDLEEVYGGAKQADLTANVTLNITSGHIKKVFGGNNISGKLNGVIKVQVDETGCFPVEIENLYLGGNEAAYSVYGYNDDGTVKTSGEAKADPVLNIVSCTTIDRVFGGGLGETATIVGNPVVNVNLIPGDFAANIDANGDGNPDGNANVVGTIGTIFGGGDAAPVQGNTTINIGTDATAKHITGNDQTTDHAVTNAISGDIFGGGLGATAIVTGNTNVTVQGNTSVDGNVYGGGNAAEVQGTTNVQIGEECI